MAQYLTEEEILKYCTTQAGVSIADVIIASELIDGFIGKSFTVNEVAESIKVNEKRRGKLNYNPVLEVLDVSEVVITPIGVTKQKIAPDKLVFDIENDGYFTYIAPNSPFCACEDLYFGRPQKKLEVKYSYGYAEVPNDIKIVCAMLAQNIRQFQSFVGFKKLNTLDYTVEMSNPSFFTDDMRTILNKYR